VLLVGSVLRYALWVACEPPLFAGNLVPAVLRQLGVLWVSDEISAVIESQEELPAGVRK
jgi:hypothetical protein